MSFYKKLMISFFISLVAIVGMLSSTTLVQAQTNDEQSEIDQLQQKLARCKKSQLRLKKIAKNARLQLKTCEAKSQEETCPAATVNDNDQQIADLSETVESLQAQLAAKEKAQSRLKGIAQNARKQLKVCNGELAACEEKSCPTVGQEAEYFETQRDAAQREVKRLRTQLATAQQEAKRFKTQLAAAQQEAKRFKTQRDAALQQKAKRFLGTPINTPPSTEVVNPPPTYVKPPRDYRGLAELHCTDTPQTGIFTIKFVWGGSISRSVPVTSIIRNKNSLIGDHKIVLIGEHRHLNYIAGCQEKLILRQPANGFRELVFNFYPDGYEFNLSRYSLSINFSY
jgi:hypothetical protein